MNALDRFKELLKTATPEAKELVEVFNSATEEWHECDNPQCDWPIEQMRFTPQAAAPVSVEAEVVAFSFGDELVVKFTAGIHPEWAKTGDLVRITKIEGAK
jgi:hypothetical protein